VTLARNPN